MAVSELYGQVVRAASSARTFLRGVMGADAYERYVQHHERVHPGEPVLTEREFWRQKADDEDRNPSARCC